MARTDWQYVSGTTNSNSVFFTGIRWRYRDDLFGTTGYPTDRISSNTDIIEYQPYVGKYQAYTSMYYVNWLTSNYKYSYNTVSGEKPPAASNNVDISTTFRFDQANTYTNYYLTQGNLSSGNVMNTASSMTSRIIQVPHCSDGTSKVRLYFYFQGNSNTYFTYAETNQIVTLETIPRANKITVTDANIGSGTSIIINKTNPDFTTSIYYKAFDESSWTLIVDKTNTDGAYGWTVPTSFYSKIPNSPTMICYFKAETYNGNTLIGEDTTQATFTATGNPTVSSCVVESIDTITTNLVGSSKMIKYISTVQVSVNASPAHNDGSSITSIVVNGIVATNGVATFNNASVYSYQVIVTDSRGYSTTNTYTIGGTDYIPLTLNANVLRNQPTDGIIKVSYNGDYFNDDFIASDDTPIANTLTVQYRSREVNGTWGNWTNLSPTTSGNTYSQSNYQISGYNYQKQYEFQIKATDRVSERIIEGITIPRGEPVYWWNNNGLYVNGNLKKNNSEVALSSEINNAILTIQQNGTDVATFGANASSNVTANITTPTKESDLETVLYDSNDATGTNGNVTCSASLFDYNEIDIYFRDNGYGGYGFKKISGDMLENASNKIIRLTILESYTSSGTIAFEIRGSEYSVSSDGTLLTKTSSQYVNIYNRSISNATSDNFIYIYKIVGKN